MREVDERPLVSIVTPSFQQARFLADNLRSVAEQDYPAIEHVVRDGGSSDGSVELLRSSDVRWTSQHDRGQTDALNRGIEEARGAIIGWLNSDDFLYPGAVRAAVDAMAASGADAVYGACRLVDERRSDIGVYRTEPFSYERLLLRNIIAQPALFFRKTMYQRCGPLDESLSFAMDYEYWLRCARQATFLYVPRIFAAYRIHSEGKTMRSAVRHAAEANAVRLRYGRDVLPIWRLSLANVRTSVGGMLKSSRSGVALLRRLSWRRNAEP